MAKTLPLFDYADLDQATSTYLREKSAEVKALMRQTVENVVRTGLILQEVKSKLPYGKWAAWCEAEFGWNQRTADRMIGVAEKFSLDTLSNIDIGTSALYILSAPTTPEEAREEALRLANQGQKITQAAAKDLRDQHLGPNLERGRHKKHDPQLELDVTKPQTTATTVTATPLTKTPETKTTRKPGKRERLKKTPGQQISPLVADKSLITSKAKIVEPGQTWRLGGFHILYCGEPTDPKFLKRLPQQASLLLEFPSTLNPLPPSIVNHFQSHLSFTTALREDFDLGVLREIVKATLEGTTDGGDKVVLHCLPDPAIFLLIDQLECIGFCAEPDPIRCNMAIAAWTTVTKRAASRV
jgi:hypothetical protein